MQRKDLVIQKADKGNTVVITNPENYLEGMKSLLSDNSKFIELNTDKSKLLNYIANLKKKLNEDLKTLENNNKISEDEFKNICSIGTRPGILYRLPKVHKIVIGNIAKFRPILSAICTPVYKFLWFLFYDHLQLMTLLSKIHFPLLKKLLILIIIFLWQV